MVKINCSSCWLSEYVKNWFVRGTRRYKCKLCWNNFLEKRKKRLTNKDKLTILEKYLEWETITFITKSYEWYTIAWIWKCIDLFKKKIKNFEKLKEKQTDLKHYLNVLEISRYKNYIKNINLDYWYCELDWKYWLIISTSRINNSYLKDTMKENELDSFDEFSIKYGGIFKN